MTSLLSLPRLLLVTPPAGDLTAFEQAANAVGGRDLALLLRRQGQSDRSLWKEATRLRERCVAPLIVHRRPDIACAVEAAGVHLPEWGLPLDHARHVLQSDGRSRWLGVSRHDAEGLMAAEGVADYATLSPYAAVAEKGPPLGASRFAEMRLRAPSLWVLALGGITPSIVGEALGAGANGVAVLRGVSQARELYQRVIEPITAFEAGPPRAGKKPKA